VREREKRVKRRGKERTSTSERVRERMKREIEKE